MERKKAMIVWILIFIIVLAVILYLFWMPSACNSDLAKESIALYRLHFPEEQGSLFGPYIYALNSTNRDIGLAAYYVISQGEALSDEKIIGYAFNSSKSGTAPLYSINKYSNQSEIVAYLFENNVPNSVALYKIYNKNNAEILYTSDIGERTNAITNGWTEEGIVGYLYASGSCSIN